MHMALRPKALDLDFAKKVLRLDILSRLFDFERKKSSDGAPISLHVAPCTEALDLDFAKKVRCDVLACPCLSETEMSMLSANACLVHASGAAHLDSGPRWYSFMIHSYMVSCLQSRRLPARAGGPQDDMTR